MKVLVSNDDGRFAPGINALIDFLGDYDPVEEVAVSAPVTQNSGKAISITTAGNNIVVASKGERDCIVAGTPADSSSFGMEFLFKNNMGRLPDLVISGINDDLNTGINILYSGTVGACVESFLRGVPSIALSADSKNANDKDWFWANIGPTVRKVFNFIFDNDLLSKDYILNVNIPSDFSDIEGIAIVEQNMNVGHFRVGYSFAQVEGCKGLFEVISIPNKSKNTLADSAIVQEGKYITLTPLRPDLTVYSALKNIRDKFNGKEFVDFDIC